MRISESYTYTHTCITTLMFQLIYFRLEAEFANRIENETEFFGFLASVHVNIADMVSAMNI